jgi:hypothetical protein
MPSSDQCAIGTDGNLLDESKIVWYNDAEDSVPIAPRSFTATSQLLPLRPSTTSSGSKATTLLPFIDFAESDSDDVPKWKGKGRAYMDTVLD